MEFRSTIPPDDFWIIPNPSEPGQVIREAALNEPPFITEPGLDREILDFELIA